MLSVPYSRMLLGIIPWYSFLIVLGASIAIAMAVREEKRGYLKKDTVLDFSLIVLPCGIIGARVYYVLFSWDRFKNDLLSVFRIWEGGIAIYGAVIAGLLTAFLFCRKRRVSFPVLCDLVAPGLVLAQAIGRWGNYFNREAYGIQVTAPELCFFPFAVLIDGESGLQWHMATFFYESVWNFMVFVFLIFARRRFFRFYGDVICFYAYLYACGRLVIEDFRMDSLYASSAIRISQLLSVLVCIVMLLRYFKLLRKKGCSFTVFQFLLLASSLLTDVFMIAWMAGLVSLSANTVFSRFMILFVCSTVNIVTLFVIYGKNAEGEIVYADVKN